MNSFGLTDLKKSYINKLSGGEKQKLSVVLALIGNPEIVFLDELTTDLDVAARREVWRTLKYLKEKGLTVFLTTHYMSYITCTIVVGEIMFKCDCCGLCCCNLDKSSIYQDLDRGDGVCKYFDENTRLCKIYENRPLKCRIDEMYDNFFSEEMTIQEFYKINYEACEKLKKEGSWNVFRNVK